MKFWSLANNFIYIFIRTVITFSCLYLSILNRKIFRTGSFIECCLETSNEAEPAAITAGIVNHYDNQKAIQSTQNSTVTSRIIL